MAFTFKRWFHAEYTFRDEKIGFDLKHLTAFEEREVRTHVVRAMGAIEGLKARSAETDQEIVAEVSAKTLEKLGESLPMAFTREVFEKYVKNVSNVVDEDGAVRTDGPVIMEFADDTFVWFVLLRLLENGKVTAAEGKASGSPSTSASVAEPASSASVSPATSTASVVSISLSTATPIPAPSPSSAPEPSQGT